MTEETNSFIASVREGAIDEWAYATCPNTRRGGSLLTS